MTTWVDMVSHNKQHIMCWDELMNMTAQNKLHLPKPNAQTVWDGFGVGVGMDSM